MIVGGYAVMLHMKPRYTKDLDLWIDPVEDNARRMIEGLNEFGPPTAEIQLSDFTEPEVFFQIGVKPVRIDILTSVKGLNFDGAWGNAALPPILAANPRLLSRADIPAAKIAAARLRDRKDATHLRM